MLGDKASIEQVGKNADELLNSFTERFMQIGPFLRDLDKAETVEEIHGLIAGHGFDKTREYSSNKRDVTITTVVDANDVYRQTAAKVLDNKAIRKLGGTCSELRAKLRSMSYDLLRNILKEDSNRSGAIMDAASALLGSTDARKHIDRTESIESVRNLYAAQRLALNKTVSYLSKLITEIELVVYDLIRADGKFINSVYKEL